MLSWVTRLATRAWTVVAALDKAGAGGAFEYLDRRIIALEARMMRLEAAGPAAVADLASKRFDIEERRDRTVTGTL